MKVAQEIQDAAKAVIEENRQLRKVVDELRRERGINTQSTNVGHGGSKAEELERKLGRAGPWHHAVAVNSVDMRSKKRKLDIAAAVTQPDFTKSTGANGGSTISSLSPADSNPNGEPYPARSAQQHHVPARSFPTTTGHRHRDTPRNLSDKHYCDVHHLLTPPKEPVSQSVSDVSLPDQVRPALREELNSTDDTSSCAFAVAILTSMRADVSAEDVKADLGCSTDFERCKVDNKRLFGAVDRYTG